MPIEIVQWAELQLPDPIDELLKEAADTGHDWVADLRPQWRLRPFIGLGEALFLAWEDDRLLATAAISSDPFVSDGTTGRLRFIYVRLEARRRGIADGLVERCMVRANGCWRRLRLHTDNPVAAKLYARYGFRTAENEPRSTHVVDMAPR